ncbi:MAG TPA: VCBS repeat-containing protein [Candidatus Limnocylindria bacterium]|nr:VCBS repeat-containing protein [Candidatus Limnocylindria bacterium]
MSHPRPSAWALICVLVIGLLGSAGTAITLAGNPPKQCTGWTDEFHPPTSIRVRIGRGPDAPTVAEVPFWDYVGTVLAAEYSTSGPRGAIWQRMGAQSVKQYGWYYAMHWRGGNVTKYNEDGTVASVECFDVKDTTADQIYKPIRLVNGEWIPANTPSENNLQAMRETWPNSLRKWVPDKQKSRFFLSGYRSGNGNPCGTDSDGFKVFQKSLADCNLKGLNYEETQRRYYEPRLLIVDPREHDILDDPGATGPSYVGSYFGDLGVLAPGANANKTGWRLYAGLDGDAGFAAPVTGSFDIASAAITSQGIGDVTGDSRNDLLMLVAGKVRVAVANGTGYADPTAGQDVPAGVTQMVVGDFNGDLLADVGLLRPTLVEPLPNEPATLVVMRGNANGSFSAAQDWWRGAINLVSQQVAAGDVNGDGKADLVIRDATAGATFYVAPSFASCADPAGYNFTYRGECTNVPGTGLDVAAVWLDKPNWNASETSWTLSDFNRDSRSDLVAVLKNGGGVDVFGAAATLDSTFGETKQMWSTNNQPFAEVVPLGLDVNPDGLGDLALLKKHGANTTVQWLKAVQTGSVVTYTPTNGYDDGSLPFATAKAY